MLDLVPPPSSTPAPLDWAAIDLVAAGLGVAALLCAGATAVIRRSLAQSVPERVVGGLPQDSRRGRLEDLLAKADRLGTSAAVMELAFSLLFAVSVLWAAADEGRVTAGGVLLILLVCVPVLWFVTDALARGIALRLGDPILRASLAAFHLVQLPHEALAWAFEGVRRGVLRLLGLHDDPESTRQIVAGLREVIEDAEISGRLDET
jgi:hypothetical protein